MAGRTAPSLVLALLVPALLMLAPSCDTPATDTRALDSLENASKRTLAGLLQQFKAQNLPASIPDPGIPVDAQEVMDKGYLDLAFIGKGKTFETKPDGAVIYYSKLNTTGRYLALVIALQKNDGVHYHLCTFTPEGKAIDQKEIAFDVIGDKLEGKRTAIVSADMRVVMTERMKTFTVLTPDQMTALRTNSVLRESKSERTESYQVSAEGKISEGAWQRAGEPKADSASK